MPFSLVVLDVVDDSRTTSVMGIRRVGQAALIGALYYTAGKLGLLLAIPPGYAAAVWPASGIALAGTLSLGYHVWLRRWMAESPASLT